MEMEGVSTEERCWVEKGPEEGKNRQWGPAMGCRKSLLWHMPGEGQEREWEQREGSLGDRKLGHIPCGPRRGLSEEWSTLRGKALLLRGEGEGKGRGN